MIKTDPVFTYPEFSFYMEELVSSGKTSGNLQTQNLIDYTALNQRRMHRLNKTVKLHPELISLLKLNNTVQEWVVITEAWCGDSAQSLPVIAKMAEVSEKIDLKIILRDLNPQWMEKYHTNGSRSIPKLIAFDESGEELFTWGPKPAPAQQILIDWKKDPNGRDRQAYETELHTWYALDKTKTIQDEFLQILNRL